jgi:hypothetical protein
VVDTRDGIDPISQEQAEWRMLTAMLGRGLTQAYLVRPGVAAPLLMLHAQDRATVETAGARIGLAKAMLVVDANGAYRGAQLYRVDNSLEQFLEIQLPAGARLWTAHVADEPVEPAAGKAGTTGDVVRIPLIKTAHGDADYPVILKYGGQLGRLGAVDHVAFPLIHTVNIHVELSQVELYVPESFDWFNFGGTMRLVHCEGDLTAGWLAYNTRQIGLATQALHSEDPFTRARAAQNLKTLQEESAALKESAQGYRGNSEVAQQLQANVSIQAGLDVRATAKIDQSQGEAAADNRARFGRLYKSQTNARANDVVNSSPANFAQPAVPTAPPPTGAGKDQEQGFGARSTTMGGLVDEPFVQPSAVQGNLPPGFDRLPAGDGASRPSGLATTAGASIPPETPGDKFGPITGEEPGQTPISTLTISGAGATSVNGNTLNLPGPADQPEFQERGGGGGLSVQRYAGRLAQQTQGASQESIDANGSVFDWGKNTWARNTAEPVRGPQRTTSVVSRK